MTRTSCWGAAPFGIYALFLVGLGHSWLAALIATAILAIGFVLALGLWYWSEQPYLIGIRPFIKGIGFFIAYGLDPFDDFDELDLPPLMLIVFGLVLAPFVIVVECTAITWISTRDASLWSALPLDGIVAGGAGSVLALIWFAAAGWQVLRFMGAVLTFLRRMFVSGARALCASLTLETHT